MGVGVWLGVCSSLFSVIAGDVISLSSPILEWDSSEVIGTKAGGGPTNCAAATAAAF